MGINIPYFLIIIVIIGFVTLIAGVALFSVNKSKKKNTKQNTSTTGDDTKGVNVDDNSAS